MTVSAPRRLSFSSFSSEEDVAITRAPAAFANCSANSDTLPVPRISTVSPVLHLAAHHQASPGGDSGAGERCRLHMRVACRCLREEVRRHARVLAGIAVNTLSRYIPLGSGRHFASQPIGPKRADDGISNLELIDIVPDRNHFSSAIGHRNAAVGARYFP